MNEKKFGIYIIFTERRGRSGNFSYLSYHAAAVFPTAIFFVCLHFVKGGSYVFALMHELSVKAHFGENFRSLNAKVNVKACYRNFNAQYFLQLFTEMDFFRKIQIYI